MPQSSQPYNRAFILAAGKGTRLKPYTDHCPKPLVKVKGMPIIDHVLDNLAMSGITDITVNLHYMAEMMEEHLRDRDDEFRFNFLREKELLDTGGGLKQGLPHMKGQPFFAVSGDSLWTDGDKPALERMAKAWDPAKMDLLLLLQPLETMLLTDGVGDYDLDKDGRAIRSPDQKGAYMWTSVRLCAPALFEGSPDGPFSFLTLMDKAEKAGRLYGLVHDGKWHHISTPEDLLRVNKQAVLDFKRSA